jgi:hypothetical protein
MKIRGKGEISRSTSELYIQLGGQLSTSIESWWSCCSVLYLTKSHSIMGKNNLAATLIVSLRQMATLTHAA